MDSQDVILATSLSQLQLRPVETHAFDITDRAAILRAVIATLQDLGFIVERADETIGTVTGTKLSGYASRMTVTLRPVGKRILPRKRSVQPRGGHRPAALPAVLHGPEQSLVPPGQSGGLMRRVDAGKTANGLLGR